MSNHSISKSEAEAALASFQNNPIRRMSYQIAKDLIDSTLNEEKPFDTAEALSLMLENLNRAHYKKIPFDKQHLAEIKRLLRENNWQAFRSRDITSLTADDRIDVLHVYSYFEHTLGSVGASKALNLLAPDFFPIWNPTTAKAYGLELLSTGSKFEKYWEFMQIAKQQRELLAQLIPNLANPLNRSTCGSVR